MVSLIKEMSIFFFFGFYWIRQKHFKLFVVIFCCSFVLPLHERGLVQNHELSDSANNHGARAHFFALVQQAFSVYCQKIRGLRLTIVLQPFH